MDCLKDCLKKIVFFSITFFLFGCAHSFFNKNIWKPNYKVYRDIFPNGLTVLFVEDHSVPLVSYITWFKVGSSVEKKGSTGIAHLFEHLMFKGTPRFGPKQFFKTLESKGAVLNAFTQKDATVYYEMIASEHLELVIDMETDRLKNLTFSQKDLNSEREVVQQERKLRVESSFNAQHLEKFYELAFPDHPYGRPIIGYEKDLEKLTLNECNVFFKTYYQPSNAIVVIAGGFQYEKAKELIKKYYPLTSSISSQKREVPEFAPPGKEIRFKLSKPVKTETLLMGYYIPSLYHADSPKLSMLAWALFGMSSSQAQQILIREKKIALSVGAHSTLEQQRSLFVISAEMKTNEPASKAEMEIEKLLEEMKTKHLSDAELERVKNRLVYSTINDAKSPTSFANSLASGEFFWGDHMHIFKMLNDYYKMEAHDLQEVAKKYFNKENRVVVVMQPI